MVEESGKRGGGTPKHLLGVDWAPLNVPLDRRLQTLAVIQYVFMFILLPFLSIGIPAYLLFTKWWWISMLYGLWFWYDYDTPKRGSRPSKWFQNMTMWKYFVDYFPIKIRRTVPLDPNRNYIIGYHPHGVLGFGDYGNFCTGFTGFKQNFPGITPHPCTLVGQFWFPFRREFMMAAGGIEVSKQSIRYVLTKMAGMGHAVVIVIGGAVEALETKPGQCRLHLKNRKGFVKMALQTGADLVPCFTFGENDTFSQVDNPEGSYLRKFQIWFKMYAGFSPPILKGRGIFNYTFGILPFRRPITTIVGTPIPVEHALADPSDAMVDELHKKYCDGLVELYETNKGEFGFGEEDHLVFC